MTFALVAHVAAAAATTFTTGSINTSGADLLVVNVSRYAGSGAVTFGDSKVNTWTPLTEQANIQSATRLYYCLNPIVGSGHNFTATNSSIFGTIQATAWSGSNTAGSFDLQNGQTGTATTSVQPGTLTPSENNCLVITGVSPADGSSGAIAVDGGFTISDQNPFSAGVNEGGALAYLIQTTAAAANPNWSWSLNANSAAVIASFKAAAGGAVLVPWAQRFTRVIGGIHVS